MKVKGFKEFNKINEKDEIDDLFDREIPAEIEDEEPQFTGDIDADKEKDSRYMFDDDHEARMELVKLFKQLTNFIKKSYPKNEEDLVEVKAEIKRMNDAILNHPNYDELKEKGFPWQDSTLRLSDLLNEIEEALEVFRQKTEGKI